MVSHAETPLVSWQIKSGPAGVWEGVYAISLQRHHWGKQLMDGSSLRVGRSQLVLVGIPSSKVWDEDVK